MPHGIECSKYEKNYRKYALISYFRVPAFFFFLSIRPSAEKTVTMSEMFPAFKKLINKGTNNHPKI